jgi:hypothetical protein
MEEFLHQLFAVLFPIFLYFGFVLQHRSIVRYRNRLALLIHLQHERIYDLDSAEGEYRSALLVRARNFL